MAKDGTHWGVFEHNAQELGPWFQAEHVSIRNVSRATIHEISGHELAELDLIDAP
jgi:hypothetical protein